MRYPRKQKGYSTFIDTQQLKKFINRLRLSLCALVLLLLLPSSAMAVFVTVDGSDAIWLAGRTDIVIPPASDPWGPPDGMLRHSGPTPEEIQETLPPFLSLSGGDEVKVSDLATGGISFFNGFGAPLYGPSGNGVGGSTLSSFGGISGYLGPEGPLVGVFLDDSIPDGTAPVAINFNPVGDGGIGIDFLTLSPDLGQIFYIGDGVNSGGEFQSFFAPTGATRVFFGIPDGFGFDGVPGAYDDNDGAYRIGVGINEPPPAIPVPAAVWLFGTALIGLAGFARRKKAA